MVRMALTTYHLVLLLPSLGTHMDCRLARMLPLPIRRESTAMLELVAPVIGQAFREATIAAIWLLLTRMPQVP